MRSLDWDRSKLIAEIRGDLWRYLTPAASIEEELLEAAALLKMHPSELRQLGRLQFLTSEELGLLLAKLPFLVRRLATTTASEEEWSADRIRGSISWARTIGVRQATGIPHMYVTAPARRAFQTPENELLVLLLDAVVAHGRQSGWHRSQKEDVGKLINARVSEAKRWLQTRALGEVERRPITATKLARIRGGRHRRRYQVALDAYEQYRLLAERLDHNTIRRAVETRGLVTRDDPTLFELICTFHTIRALQLLGWQMSRLGLFAGFLRLKGTKGDENLILTYQSTPSQLSTLSAYRTAQSEHSIPVGALRPDLVIHHRRGDQRSWLVIEAKGGTREVEHSARAAVFDLLAYRTAFDHGLATQTKPYGLGIAFGAELAPTQTGELMLCTPDTLATALERFLA
jgi:hypothetical protein